MADTNISDSNQVVFTPHEGQHKIFSSKKRFILVVAGVQGGKTVAGCLFTQLEVQKQPEGNHLICALSHDQLSNVVIDKFFSFFPQYRQFFNKTEKTIYLPTGGKIFFRSLEDPKYVEGITAHSAWIDEGDLVGYRGYLVVRGRLNATGGRMLITSSLADNSWLAEHMGHFDESEFEIITWASNLNPSFSEAEWESLKREIDPVIFRRRYEAQLDFASGLVYSNFDWTKHLLPAIQPGQDPLEGINIIKAFMGVDWGWVDPVALVVILMDDIGKLYVVNEFVMENAPLDLIVSVARRFKEKWNVKLIYADSENPALVDHLNSKVGGVLKGDKDIFSGTAQVRNLIYQDRLYVTRNCRTVIRELKTYRFREALIGRSEEPQDKNNHTLDSLRYVVATYPLGKLKYKQKEKAEELTPFWQRRTALYKKLKTESKGSLSNLTSETAWIP